MRFTFRQLEIFVEVAKDENFRLSADRLGISQPTISNHIRALEERAGGKLFDRRRGSAARLLPLGRELLVEARKLLNSADKVARAGQNSGPPIQTLKVAAGDFILDYVLRPALKDYHRLEGVPDIELIAATPGRTMTAMLDEGMADICFFTGAAPDEPGMRAERLCAVSVGLYASPALAQTVAAAERLDDAPFILAAQNSPTDRWFMTVLGGLGLAPRHVAARSQYPDVILELVCAGKGIGLLFDDMARPRVAAGQLLRLPLRVPSSHRYMVFARNFTDPGVLRSIAFLRKTVRTLGG
ncbi:MULTISPECIES: LysR family transcriptional regulator [unclassified Novosphingobium]|uniref:LysR family transcriptional regulator n=1 Tax=unclassified Novosphingobium TaxID=2644732 RepID=UPI000868C62C|nr:MULTISPECIES: LysR family transcriptional regulator [unclassified Novosphingobium]MDR6707356.1 DNA-binding transcriptional LysR family regulator [Novosphingobium sp. 1748]ODU83309.1 MAG: hypothetical protein ABT10_06765 [Novosphingobium sp. SCN 63-17]OJX96421.1 MAG: hypothetical protein BGP00_17860 [Novosphingobium sp. 63-713]